MIEQTISDFRAHAGTEFPRECCGLVAVINGRERYLPCRNAAETSMEHFVIHADDWVRAEELGTVVAVCHSHPNTAAKPGSADKTACEASGLPWHVVHVSKDDTGRVRATEIVTIHPCGYQAPYVGRLFVHGIHDCYSLVRDFYARELGVTLPDFADRRDLWWNRGDNLYMDNVYANGFVRVTAPEYGDLILMQIRSPVPNHGGVYVGDGKILHHVYQRMSSEDLLDGYFQENISVILRHKDARRHV